MSEEYDACLSVTSCAPDGSTETSSVDLSDATTTGLGYAVSLDIVAADLDELDQKRHLIGYLAAVEKVTGT